MEVHRVRLRTFYPQIIDNLAFTIVLEPNDDGRPSTSVGVLGFGNLSPQKLFEDSMVWATAVAYICDFG